MRIALAGFGKTGQEVAEYLFDQKESALAAVVVHAGSTKIGWDIGEYLGRKPVGTFISSSDELAVTLQHKRPHVLLDFSHPDFIRTHIETVAASGVHIVLATTGYSPTDMERIKYYTHKYHIGTVVAPNITYGVNVLMELCKFASKLMGSYDFEIIESHHRNKKDSPSGTAKRIADTIALEADCGDIPIHSIRAGGIIGDHKVVISGPNDKLELRHESFSRRAFAQGALWAASFISKNRGFYLMEDVFAATGFTKQVCSHCGNVIEEASPFLQQSLN